MNQYTSLWTPRELEFLRCPIPAAFLASGALRGRSEDSIRSKRWQLGIKWGSGFAVPLRHSQTTLTPRAVRAGDYAGVDWSKTLKTLMQETGLGINSLHSMRHESGLFARNCREGRRAYHFTDFKVDWRNDSTAAIARVTGLSRPVIYRLRNEYHRAHGASAVPLKFQRRRRKVNVKPEKDLRGPSVV